MNVICFIGYDINSWQRFHGLRYMTSSILTSSACEPTLGQFVVLPDITDIDLFLVAGVLSESPNVRWCTCWSVCSYLNPITLLYPCPTSPQPNMAGYSQSMLHLQVVPFTCSTQRGKGAFLWLLCACCYVLLVEHGGALESWVWYAWRPILEEG